MESGPPIVRDRTGMVFRNVCSACFSLHQNLSPFLPHMVSQGAGEACIKCMYGGGGWGSWGPHIEGSLVAQIEVGPKGRELT